MSKLKTAGIILAAGGSKRLGRPKQLLDWFGKPFIQQVIETVKLAGLSPIIVVTGAHSQEVEACISDEQVIVTFNSNWKSGQSSSMIKGVESLEPYSVDQFVFFLCDQPQISVNLVKGMLEESKDENVDIVQTTVSGKTCPPTLFKKSCIDDIKKLQGDQGGRALMESHRTKKIEHSDEKLLLDCDTEEDYRKLIESFR